MMFTSCCVCDNNESDEVTQLNIESPTTCYASDNGDAVVSRCSVLSASACTLCRRCFGYTDNTLLAGTSGEGNGLYFYLGKQWYPKRRRRA